jgi:hypothetical protein
MDHYWICWFSKNASHDIKGTSANPKFVTSHDMSMNCVQGIELEKSKQSLKLNYDSHSNNLCHDTWRVVPKTLRQLHIHEDNPDNKQIIYNVKLVLDVKLSDYTTMGKLLRSNKNTPLNLDIIALGIKENDLIELKLEGLYNGIYKIISLGSDSNPWVLKKV